VLGLVQTVILILGVVAGQYVFRVRLSRTI
jgi:hypothetical protein